MENLEGYESISESITNVAVSYIVILTIGQSSKHFGKTPNTWELSSGKTLRWTFSGQDLEGASNGKIKEGMDIFLGVLQKWSHIVIFTLPSNGHN